jgi:hypothetical protein
MRDSCTHAIGKGYSKIREENVRYAIKQLPFRFERAIHRSPGTGRSPSDSPLTIVHCDSFNNAMGKRLTSGGS